MTAWTSDELTRIGAAEELQISSRRDDGSLGSERTIWVVRVDDDVYVRSVNGPTPAWFRSTRVMHAGHIRAGGFAKDVSFVDVDAGANKAVDAAYRDKYRHYATSIIDAITSDRAASTTMRLVPHDS